MLRVGAVSYSFRGEWVLWPGDLWRKESFSHFCRFGVYMWRGTAASFPLCENDYQLKLDAHDSAFLKTACLLKINSYSTSMHKWVTLLFHNFVGWRREKKRGEGHAESKVEGWSQEVYGRELQISWREGQMLVWVGQFDLDLASLWLIHGHLTWNKCTHLAVPYRDCSGLDKHLQNLY